jgi:hypothetical protein
MPFSVEREFSVFYDKHVGRISIHLGHSIHTLIVNVINLIIEPGCIRIHVNYPETMHIYDAIQHVLASLTRDFGKNIEGFVYDYKDCVFDTISKKEYLFKKDTVELLSPTAECFVRCSYGALDDDGNLRYTCIVEGNEALIQKEITK